MNSSSYISSSHKLLQHTDRLHGLQRGKPRPITIECAPTDICQLDCSYCSVMFRPKNVIDYDLLINTIDKYSQLGAKSIVFTGGGDPTLYPEISDLICMAVFHGLEVGLITNGLELRRIERLQDLTWLRISLNLDQSRGEKLGERLDAIKIPDNVTFGFSYVTDGDKKMFDISAEFAKRYSPEYVRVVGNCIGTTDVRKTIAAKSQKLVDGLNDSRFFFSYKLAEAPEGCYQGYLKPFLYADGYVYPCSSCVLGEQKFPERFRMYHASEVFGYYDNLDVKSIVDTSGCPFCVLTEQNNFLNGILQEAPHANFV